MKPHLISRLDSSDKATEIMAMAMAMAMATTLTIFRIMIATMRAERGRHGGYMYDFIRVSLMQASCSTYKPSNSLGTEWTVILSNFSFSIINVGTYRGRGLGVGQNQADQFFSNFLFLLFLSYPTFLHLLYDNHPFHSSNLFKDASTWSGGS